jgi:hypothetical protein
MKFEIHFEFRASLRKFQDLNFWDATLVDAGTGESVLLLTFLLACRRGGHDGACHA